MHISHLQISLKRYQDHSSTSTLFLFWRENVRKKSLQKAINLQNSEVLSTYQLVVVANGSILFNKKIGNMLISMCV